jgi:hypothetical protein
MEQHFHYKIHNSRKLDCSLSQTNAVHKWTEAEPNECSPQPYCILRLKNAYHNWTLYWTKKMQYITGLNPKPNKYRPQLDNILRLKKAIHKCSVSWAKRVQSTTVFILSQKNAVQNWTVYWDQKFQYKSKSYLVLHEFSPQLDPVLCYMNSVHTLTPKFI